MKYMDVQNIPGWNGFMSTITSSLHYQTSKVKYLPFVNLPASSYDAINTVLQFASQKSRAMNQEMCFVTFDQPLYAKALDILHTTTDLTNITVRLGGFHLLMSYMGSIGLHWTYNGR